LPSTLLKKLNTDIRKTTGLVVNEEDVIVDQAQGLTSVTVNIQDHDDSPAIKMVSCD